jgi:hypothetical protein
MALVRYVLHRISCCNETVRNAPKYEFWVQWSGSGGSIAKKANTTSFSELVWPVLHRLSCSKETFRNAPKHEFWVQWSGSAAIVAKNLDVTSFSELVR